MTFSNENTHLKATQSPQAMEEFHRRYEEALAKAKANLGAERPLLIGGKEVRASATFETRNPADTRQVVGRFQKGTQDHVHAAVKAAREAQPGWEALGWEKRAEIVHRAGDLMAARKYELAALMTLENGKNRVEAIYDVDEATDFLRYYAWLMREHRGFTVPMGRAFPEEECVSVMRPFGVFAVIGPFNFPLAIPTGMTSGALVTGNAAVLKPASDTPAMSWELIRILQEAGVTPGVVHYVTGGGREVGQPLMDHAGVDGVVFTGSRDVGMTNYAKFVQKRPRPYICEMGGKNAVVVTAKADLDAAVDGVLKSAFGFGGQKCSAASRAYVHEDVYGRFLPALVEKTRALVVNDPQRRDVSLGPVINKGAVETFQAAVDAAKKGGGRVLAGGTVLKSGEREHGFFVEPTIVEGLPLDHEAFRTEYFVPFLSVAPFRDLDKVIEEVNAVEYGLTSGIFSKDEKEVTRYFDRVQAGVVYANRSRGGSTGAMVGAQSFGGWKFSATTSRGAGGPHYLMQFLREQSRTYVRR